MATSATPSWTLWVICGARALEAERESALPGIGRAPWSVRRLALLYQRQDGRGLTLGIALPRFEEIPEKFLEKPRQKLP